MSSFKMKQPRADGKDWQCEFYPYVPQSLCLGKSHENEANWHTRNADCTGTAFLSKTSVVQLGRGNNDKYNAVKCYTYYIPPDA